MKDTIIVVLGLAVLALFTLYHGAKSDFEEAQRYGRMLFNQLPASEQQRLRDQWETRQDMLDPGDRHDRF
ncbi:hypothetical protein [Vreelandella massiliensis]|uniref:hypothetical protein n=1 Tax=Vreelandella massiliensis TaxID=1816686 RepID=UPI00096AB800|nr:hypothetical protein [Halomonas massiliensis]